MILEMRRTKVKLEIRLGQLGIGADEGPGFSHIGCQSTPSKQCPLGEVHWILCIVQCLSRRRYLYHSDYEVVLEVFTDVRAGRDHTNSKRSHERRVSYT